MKRQPRGQRVGVDSMVLIWGMRDYETPAADDRERLMKYRARVLIEMLDEQEAQIVVPGVLAAELLVPIEVAKHADFLREIEQRFVFQPLDVRVASVAADLYAKARDAKLRTKYTGYRVERRDVLKSDVHIIAAAKVAGATVFYSDDAGCRLVADLIMQGKDLPKKHPNFAVDEEIRDKLGIK